MADIDVDLQRAVETRMKSRDACKAAKEAACPAISLLWARAAAAQAAVLRGLTGRVAGIEADLLLSLVRCRVGRGGLPSKLARVSTA